jgi:putative MATE family efflux protein
MDSFDLGAFRKTLWRLSLPIALQSMISYSVNLMDTIMLGSLGETAISATTLANQLFFIFTIACVGITGGGIVLSSQYWGKGDLGAIRKIMSITLRIAILVASVFTALALLFPAQIIGIYTRDPEVISAGIDYLRIVAASYILYGITSTLLTILRSVENVRISAYIYIVSFVANVFFNYMFIFGRLGAPRLGIAGAAIGTVIARLIEIVIVLIYMLIFEKKIQYRIRMIQFWDKLLFRDMIQYGLPVLLNETLWAVGISIHSAILGRIGSDVVAANSIAFVVYQMTTSIILGNANASAVIIGKIIGQRDYLLARATANRLRNVYFYVGLGCALFMLLVRKPVITLYNIQDATRQMAGELIAVYAVIIFFMSFACSFLMGIFRGSGDTRFALITDISCLWSAIPIGAAAAFLFHVNPVIVCGLLRLDMPMKAIICLFRLKSGKWIKNVTRDETGEKIAVKEQCL